MEAVREKSVEDLASYLNEEVGRKILTARQKR